MPISCKKCGRWKGVNHKCPENNPMQGVHRYKDKSPRWNGGKMKVNGYIWVFSPEHPYD